MLKNILLAAGSIAIMTAATISNAVAAEPENTLNLQLSTGGPVTIELNAAAAPKHIERIKQLTREGFYNGVVFHRVIDGFMAQTGDPTGTGTGGSKYPDLPAEFSDTNYGRGTVGMARKGDPNSANSQFFICFQDCSFLNKQYTVIGQVTSGMEFVDKVARGEPPANPDKIVKAEIAADVGKSAAPAANATAPQAAPAAAPTAEGEPSAGGAPAQAPAEKPAEKPAQ